MQFHLDHIIPRSRWNEYVEDRIAGLTPLAGRRGPDHWENYVWSCPFCNTRKGNRVTVRLRDSTVRLFDPRHDRWSDHFGFSQAHLFIVGRTPIGEASERVLGFNGAGLDGPLGVRHQFIVNDLYPPAWIAR